MQATNALRDHLKLLCKSAILEDGNYVRRHNVLSGHSSQLCTNELPTKKEDLTHQKMNTFKKCIFTIFAIILLIPFTSFSQTVDQNDSSTHKLKEAARAIMATAGTCALITVDDGESPMVRVMDPFPPEADFTVWFGTNPKSRKVNQITKNPKVTLYYLAADASGYVVIHGIAQLVDDQLEKDKHWKEEWEAFYPNKTDGYLLIKVTPKSMEIISYTHGIVGDPETWKPPVVLFDSK